MGDFRFCGGDFRVSVDGWWAWAFDTGACTGCGESCFVVGSADDVSPDSGETLRITGLDLPLFFGLYLALLLAFPCFSLLCQARSSLHA